MRKVISLLGMTFILLGTAASGSPRPLRIAMVIAPRDFTDQEYFEPRGIFEKAGAAIVTCCTSRQAAISHNGVKVMPDAATPDLTLEQFDAIVVAGGVGAATYLLKDEPLRKILVAARDQGRIVAAICLAPAVLAQAGVLRNVAATCYPDAATVNFLKRMGASYADKTVVVSGRIITGNGPAASGEFARRVLAASVAP